MHPLPKIGEGSLLLIFTKYFSDLQQDAAVGGDQSRVGVGGGPQVLTLPQIADGLGAGEAELCPGDTDRSLFGAEVDKPDSMGAVEEWACPDLGVVDRCDPHRGLTEGVLIDIQDVIVGKQGFCEGV